MKNNIESISARAGALRRAGRRAEAVIEYRKLLDLDPDQTDAWYNFALALRDEGRPEEALRAFDEALSRGVSGPEEVRVSRAVLLTEGLRRDGEAIDEFRSIIRDYPENASARLNLATLLEEGGDREAAAQCYEQILPPDDGSIASNHEIRCEALARLCQLRRPHPPASGLLKRLEAAANGKALIDPIVRANLNFALGRERDALGDYDRAFAAFSEANRWVRRAGPAYDRGRIVAEIDALVNATPAARGDDRVLTPAPVFICGMFRSGSTLVEQILAAHSQVTAGGELNLLNRITDVDLRPYPQSLRTLSDERTAALADRYVDDLKRLFPPASAAGAIVTDKRPDNFLRIGLIKRLFPNAKIIHTTRHPVDNCLSIFFEHIDQSLVGYSSDLVDCGHYYGQYRRMMARWKALFRQDIFDVDYDCLVREPRDTIGSLLEFLGLPWEEGCLEFHTLKNFVKTASVWQVRQPFHTQSSGRRRHYEKHFGPLAGALKSAGVETD